MTLQLLIPKVERYNRKMVKGLEKMRRAKGVKKMKRIRERKNAIEKIS